MHRLVLLAGEQNGLLRHHVDRRQHGVLEGRVLIEGLCAHKFIAPALRNERVLLLIFTLIVSRRHTVADIELLRARCGAFSSLLNAIVV